VLVGARSLNFNDAAQQQFVRLVNCTGSVPEALMCVFTSSGGRVSREGEVVDCESLFAALNSGSEAVTLPGVTVEEVDAARLAASADPPLQNVNLLYERLLNKCLKDRFGSSLYRCLFALSALDRYSDVSIKREAFELRAEAVRRGPSAAVPWGVLMDLAKDKDLISEITNALKQMFSTLPVSDEVKQWVLQRCAIGACGEPVALLDPNAREILLSQCLTVDPGAVRSLRNTFGAACEAVAAASLKWENTLNPCELLGLIVHVSTHLPKNEQVQKIWDKTADELDGMINGKAVISSKQFGAMLELAGLQPTPERVSAWCSYYANFLQDHCPDLKPLARFVLTRLRGSSIEAGEKHICENDDIYLKEKLSKCCAEETDSICSVILNGSRELREDELLKLQHALGFRDYTTEVQLLAVLNGAKDARAFALVCRENFVVQRDDIGRVAAIFGGDADSQYTRLQAVAALKPLRLLHQQFRGLTNREMRIISLSPELFEKLEALAGIPGKSGVMITQVISDIAELYGAGVSISDADILAAFKGQDSRIKGVQAVRRALVAITKTRAYTARGSSHDLAGYVATAAQFREPPAAIRMIGQRLAAGGDLRPALVYRKDKDADSIRQPTVLDLFQAAQELRGSKGGPIDSLWNLEAWLPVLKDRRVEPD
jgi:hypothetical protein